MKVGQVLILGYIGFNVFPFTKKVQLLFVVCDLIKNQLVILEVLMINRKNVTSQLVGQDLNKSKSFERSDKRTPKASLLSTVSCHFSSISDRQCCVL